jgi:hypothetical protein
MKRRKPGRQKGTKVVNGKVINNTSSTLPEGYNLKFNVLNTDSTILKTIERTIDEIRNVVLPELESRL